MVHVGAVADKHDKRAVDEVKTVTHDRVVRDAGELRVSGVTWGFVDPPNAAKVLRDLGFPWDQIAGMAKFLAENPEGSLVIAYAECRT